MSNFLNRILKVTEYTHSFRQPVAGAPGTEARAGFRTESTFCSIFCGTARTQTGLIGALRLAELGGRTQGKYPLGVQGPWLLSFVVPPGTLNPRLGTDYELWDIDRGDGNYSNKYSVQTS